MKLKGTPFSAAPSGLIDGSNTVYVLPCAPLAFTLSLYKNGIFQIFGFDYTLTENAVTLATAPSIGDKLHAQGFY